MKKFKNLVIILFLLSLFFINKNVSASMYTVDETTDLWHIGDFWVAGNEEASPEGQIEEILTFPGGSSQNGTLSNTVNVGILQDTLTAGGVTSTYILGFGFDLNETGQVGSNYLDILNLLITLHGQTFNLNGDTIRVANYHQGTSSGEARFQINLAYDFMTLSSSEDFIISATHAYADDGFDEYYLSSGFTLNPIPEPGTMILLGSLATGLFGVAGIRRKK